jgi:hypothetical protein
MDYEEEKKDTCHSAARIVILVTGLRGKFERHSSRH